MALELDDIRWEQDAVREAFFGLISAFGITAATSFKLSGCVVTIAGSNYSCTDGYICLSGEVYKVDAHTAVLGAGEHMSFGVDVSYDAAGLETFEDTTTHNTYEIRKAKLISGVVGMGGAMSYNAPYLFEILRQQISDVSSWIAPIFASGWSDLGGMNEVSGYRKDGFGMVELKGVITSVTPTGIIFILPAGYRPLFTRDYPCQYGLSMVVITVYPNGEVHVKDPGNTTTDIDLSLITFKTT